MNAAPKIFRLTDILTKEVSLVDRAANQRVFLLTKRGAGTRLESDGKGGFTPAAAPPDKTEKTTTSEALVEPSAAEGADTSPVNPTTQTPSPSDVAVPDSLYEALVGAIEKLTKLAGEVRGKDAAVVKSAPDFTARLVEALSAIQLEGEEVIPGWADGVFKCSRATLHKAVSTASAKLREIADSLAIEMGEDMPPHEMRWRICEVLDGLVELTRFEAAEAAMAKREGGESEGENEAYKRLASGLSALLTAELETPATLPPTVGEADAERVVKAAEGVLKAMHARLRAQARRIRELEEEPSLSHRIPVDGTRHEAERPVAWPLDMNAKRYDEDDLSFA